jgi:YD repeat-containing protein
LTEEEFPVKSKRAAVRCGVASRRARCTVLTLLLAQAAGQSVAAPPQSVPRYRAHYTTAFEPWFASVPAAVADLVQRLSQWNGTVCSNAISSPDQYTKRTCTYLDDDLIARTFRMKQVVESHWPPNGVFVEENILGGTFETDSAALIDRYHGTPRSCPAVMPVSNPIYPITGAKGLTEDLGMASIGGRRLVAVYDTRANQPSNDGRLLFSALASPSLGRLWSTNLHKRAALQLDSGNVVRGLQVSRGDGSWVNFQRDAAGNYAPDADITDRLLPITDGWRYLDMAARTEETYDSTGRLLSVVSIDGSRLTYTYSDASTLASIAPQADLLLTVTDQNGRSVQFQYEQPAGASEARIRQITSDAGTTFIAFNSAGNLSAITTPDGKTRQYLYERGDLPWAVTGIVDEGAARLATYGYDAEGRAIDTQWAGGAYRHTASYATPPSWNITQTYDASVNVIWRDHYWTAPTGLRVTGPEGAVSEISTTQINGKPYLTGRSQPAGARCSASTSSQAFDASGNLNRRDDFNGTRSCFSNDLQRGLVLTAVEGLSQAQSCEAVVQAGASLPALGRKTSTEWHPDWPLQTRLAEPGQLTTNVYNGQPDPFNGNAIASCEPGTALLPDGKPIAVLCKQAVQATTDADGQLGFGAALQAGAAMRFSTWTYNESGQVLTTRSTHGSVTVTTNSTYFADTDANHTKGDLQSFTSSTGEVTTFTQYSRAGQVLQRTDSNGVVTVSTYDARQRLLTTAVDSLMTTYEYDAVGQMKKATLPNGSWVGQDYDEAHRLKAVYDDQGNRIDYVLDQSGQRIGQTTKDPNGSLKASLERVMDALSRAQRTTGGEE